MKLVEKVACVLTGREEPPTKAALDWDYFLSQNWQAALARAQGIIDLVNLEKEPGPVAAAPDPVVVVEAQRVLADEQDKPYSREEIRVMAEGSPFLGWERADPERAPYGHCTNCGKARYVGDPRDTVVCMSGCIQALKNGKGAREEQAEELFGFSRGDLDELLGQAEARVREIVGDTSFTELGVMADRLLKKLGKGGRK